MKAIRIGVLLAAITGLLLMAGHGYVENIVLSLPNPFNVDAPQDLPSPSPDPTPIDIPSPTPIVVPDPSPVPTQAPKPQPKSFPVVPEKTPGVVVPQALVTISADVPNDEHCPCPAPITITWIGIFQGGFPGVTPTFTWSDGHIGKTDVITYDAPGNYHSPSVKVTEVYNGETYELAAANPNIPFTVT